MKLVVSGADYGMCDSITDGTLKAIREGIISDVGIMVNNDSFARAAKEIKNYPQVSLSLDINLVSGQPVSDPKDIASLVDENGVFLSSGFRKALGQHEQLDYQEVYLESENQIKRFLATFNHKPVTMNPHSYMSANSYKAMVELGKKYDICLLTDLFQDQRIKIPRGWYPNPIIGNKLEYTLQMQSETDVIEAIVQDNEGLINYDYVLMLSHPGFCDGELMNLSTYHLIRGLETTAFCSEKVKRWVKDNKIEIINLAQLIAELYQT